MGTGRRCEILGTGFEVSAEDAATGRRLAELFSGFSELRARAPVAHVVDIRAERGRQGAVLEVDGVRKQGALQPLHLVGDAVHAVNQCVIPDLDALVVHAGVVARDGVGVLLPAAMESGKSTLTAALVRAGWRYLSDEAAVVPWATDGPAAEGEVRAFPKPISLDPGSWSLFPELRTVGQGPALDYTPSQWQVAPRAFGPDAVAPACHVRLIVFRRFVPDAPTVVEPLSRGVAAVELARNTFQFDQHGRRGLDAVAALVRGAQCWRLTGGRLEDAVRTVADLAEERAGRDDRPRVER